MHLVLLEFGWWPKLWLVAYLLCVGKKTAELWWWRRLGQRKRERGADYDAKCVRE